MPEAITSRLAAWGLDMTSLTMLSGFVIWTMELIKKHVGVSGQVLLAWSAGVACIWSVAFYAPSWQAVAAATVLGWLMASGVWQGAKTLIGKVGEDGFNRPPSTLTNP